MDVATAQEGDGYLSVGKDNSGTDPHCASVLFKTNCFTNYQCAQL